MLDIRSLSSDVCASVLTLAKAKVNKIQSFGPESVMQVVEEDLPAPEPGQVQVRQEAIGFNYIDIYQRQGVYPLPLPTGLGHEAAGVVMAIGPGARSEEHTSELQSLMRSSYAVFCLKKKKTTQALKSTKR